MEIVNGYRVGSCGQPLQLWDFEDRKSVAQAVCAAAKLAGANRVVQTAAGDAAFAGKSDIGIELAVRQAGGTDTQGKAAAAAVTISLEEVVTIPSDRWEAYEPLKQHHEPVKKGWWPFSWPSFH